jgi:SAM-dependent methyltransferase
MSEPGPVRQYYASSAERERARLENPADGAVEFALTTRMLERYLPASGRVLDIGGGPGRYALWLAEHGYPVVLADLSPELLAIARDRVAESPEGVRVEQIVEADARDLSRWDDASFDAALSLGPFYHLPQLQDRMRAASELARVLRPGGVAFVAFMTRFSLLVRTIAIADERRHLMDEAWVGTLLEEGVFANDVPGRFTGGYGARPAEVAPFMEGAGFETLALVSAESLSNAVPGPLREIAGNGGPLYSRLLDIFEQVAPEPSLLGSSGHLLYVGRKRG